MLDGISTEFNAKSLERKHLEAIAPLILGEATWDAVKRERFDDWEDLKAVLQKRFGLSEN